jgi:hypothetical protein
MANPIAYMASSSVTKKKSFINLTLGRHLPRLLGLPPHQGLLGNSGEKFGSASFGRKTFGRTHLVDSVQKTFVDQ